MLEETGSCIHSNHVGLQCCFEQLASLDRGPVGYAKVSGVGR
jgi:hypothetical protein